MSLEELTTRIINIYQFYQANLFFSHLCKDKGTESSFQELLEKKEFVLNGVPLRNKTAQGIIQHENKNNTGLGPLGQTALSISLTEIVGLYFEYSKNPDFQKILIEVLEKYVPKQGFIDYQNFDSLIRFIRLCFIHGKTFVLKNTDFSIWKDQRAKKGIKEVMLNFAGKNYTININIDLDKVVDGADIHDFIDAHQSQFLLEFFYELAVTMRDEIRKQGM